MPIQVKSPHAANKDGPAPQHGVNQREAKNESNEAYAANLAAIEATHNRISGHAHRTPVFRSRAIDQMYGRRIHFKCELFQQVGAFKFRAR